jgi:protein-S-isoprenylcysteine O-methyltransferase Ste14
MDPAEQHMTETATAGVIARPPLLFLGALLLGVVADQVLPWSMSLPPVGAINGPIAGALILAGVAVFVAGIRNFSRAETPVPTNAPTRALVTTGIHGRTRNPIYLGMFLIYAGIGLALGSLSILALMLPLGLVMRYGVVAREEAYLESRFGDAYRAYKARVRRWV